MATLESNQANEVEDQGSSSEAEDVVKRPLLYNKFFYKIN